MHDIPKRILSSTVIKLYSTPCPISLELRDAVLLELFFSLLCMKADNLHSGNER